MTLLTGTMTAAGWLLTSDARAGAETQLDRYSALLQEKRALLRESGLLKQEAEVAATKSPYILFDPAARTLEFRIRGKTLKKAYSFSSIALDENGRRPASPEQIWKALQGPLTVLEKQGGRPELIPPDPETGREAGLLYSDPNQLAAQTGVVPVDTDAGLLGVDVPTDYHLKFEEDVVFHIRTAKTLTLRQKASSRLRDIAQSLRLSLAGLWGGGDSRGSVPRLSLYMTTDSDTAKNLHYSLLPGERVFTVPPPPPPITLIASKGAGSPHNGSRPVVN